MIFQYIRPSLSSVIFTLLGVGTGAAGGPSLWAPVLSAHPSSGCCLNAPRVRRSVAVGSGSMVSRVGSIMAPFWVSLSSAWTFLPQVGIISRTSLGQQAEQLTAFCIFISWKAVYNSITEVFRNLNKQLTSR